MDEATIFALASGRGRAGVAVIRISGPAAGEAVRALAGQATLPPRRAVLVALSHPTTDELLDQALALWFPGPASFTGEDVVELHIHGGPATIGAIGDALAGLPGLRLAEPGEFSRRAFQHGKFDLTAAEGLADLVAAETAVQRRQALRQLGGEMTERVEAWRHRMVRLLAHWEALIDFPEEDLPPGVEAEALAGIRSLADEIAALLDDSHRGERIREGIRIAIVGAPNAGKSSLLNRLARREAAIVSAEAGTTRDVIEVHLDLGGYAVILVDTAGLRDAEGEVEREGIRRAQAQAQDADLVLAVFDSTADPDSATLAKVGPDTLIVANKSDLGPWRGGDAIPVSALTGAGLDGLLDRLGTAIAQRFGAQAGPALTRLRHRQALEACLERLRAALTAPLPELIVEDLRLATRALGRITGRVEIDEVLDHIFRDFCIGK